MTASRWQTVQAIDFDAAAAAVYRANFPGVEVLCCPVSERLGKLPAADLILGGPPCQPFSQAGDGEGEKDARDCIPDYVAAAGEVRPRQFLMENVRGLLTKKHWPYFCRALCALEGHGYAVEWRLLDAVSFGVPQFRERVWVWGIRRDVYAAGARHLWPEPTHQWPPPAGPDLWGNAPRSAGVTVGQALGLTGYFTTGSKCRRDASGEPRGPLVKATDNPAFTIDQTPGNFIRYDHGVCDPAAPSPTVKAGGNYSGGRQGGGCPPVLVVQDVTKKAKGQNGAGWREDSPGYTVDGQGTQGVVIPYRWTDAFHRKHPPATADAPAPTVYKVIHKGGGHGLLAVDAPAHTISGESREPIQGWRDKGYVRRLTPGECARLQSVPDSFVWPGGISKTNAYKITGNGWACGMAARLSRALAAADPDGRTVLSLFCGGGLGDVGWHQHYWSYRPESEAAA